MQDESAKPIKEKKKKKKKKKKGFSNDNPVIFRHPGSIADLFIYLSA